MAKPNSDVKETKKDLFFADPSELTIIGIDTDPETDKHHALFDKASNALPVDENLTKNILFHNRVIESCQCMRDGKRVLVVNGRTRIRACREANKQLAKEGKELIKVGYTIERGEESASGVMISANEFQRRKDNLERAEKCQRLMNGGRSPKECAELFGVTIQTIDNWVALLECCAKVRKTVESDQITATAAAKLAKLSKEDQEKQLEKLLDESTGKPTVRKAAKLSKGEKQEKLFPKPTRAQLEEDVKHKDTPDDAKDVLKYVLGLAKRPW